MTPKAKSDATAPSGTAPYVLALRELLDEQRVYGLNQRAPLVNGEAILPARLKQIWLGNAVPTVAEAWAILREFEGYVPPGPKDGIGSPVAPLGGPAFAERVAVLRAALEAL